MNDASLHTAMSTLPPTDDEGYLIDPADWGEQVAAACAQREGIALTELHWRVLRLMRDCLDEHRLIPDALHDRVSGEGSRPRRCRAAAPV